MTKNSDQEVFDEFAFNVGEAEIAALEAIGQFGVIESEEMQECGVKVVNVDLVFDDVESEFVGLAEADAGFETATGHPHSKGLRMMVAAKLATDVRVALDHRCASKLAAPEDDGVVQEAALLEIFDEGGGALIG